MATFPASQPGWVSLLDEDGDEFFTLAATCGGAACRVAFDRSDRAQPVVRLVADKPGELTLSLQNHHEFNAMFFVIRRLDDDHPASNISPRDGLIVNDFNILEPLARGRITRDRSTESCMVVEAVEGNGGPLKESDEAASRAPRTRFSLSVAPAVGHGKWEPAFWTPRRWVATKAPRDGGEEPRRSHKMWVRVWLVPSGSAMLVPARPSQTVDEFKKTLAGKLEDATPERLRLYHRSEDALEDRRTLDHYHIHHESDVHAVVAAASNRRPTQGRLFSVRARCFGEEVKDLVLQLRSRTTVRELKEAARRELRSDATDYLRAVRVGLPIGLPDDWLLCEVTDEHTRVHLIVTRAHEEDSTMGISVSTVSNSRPLLLSVPKTSLTKEVKQRVQAEEGFPSHLQKVLFGGVVLEDHVRLLDYGVTRYSTLHVVLNLGGGGPALPEGAEQVEAVASTPQKDPDADLVVAKVVPGQRRAPPPTTRSHYAALLSRMAPLLIIEVSLQPQVSEIAPARPPAKKPRLS